MEEQLLEKVVASLVAALGQRLQCAEYWCLSGEANEEMIHDPLFYLGGDVHLVLADSDLFITWDEQGGWDDHFSVQVCDNAEWVPGSYEKFDVAETPIWRHHIGETLEKASVLGWRGIPHVVALTFETGTVYVGTDTNIRLVTVTTF